MTANAHTPGPWQAIKLSKYRTSIDTLDMIPVCNLEEATPADAHLIAAAPDMLAALEGFQRAWDENRLVTSDEAKAIRAAIAKARGLQ